MKFQKLKMFAGIVFSGIVIFTTLYVLCTSIEGIIFGWQRINFYREAENIYTVGYILGIVHALTFLILQWLKKAESLKHTILSILFITELPLIYNVFISIYSMSHIRFSESFYKKYYIIITLIGMDFVRPFLFILLLSFIAGAIYQKLFVRLKNRSRML